MHRNGWGLPVILCTVAKQSLIVPYLFLAFPLLAVWKVRDGVVPYSGIFFAGAKILSIPLVSMQKSVGKKSQMANFQVKTLLNQVHIQLDPYCRLPDTFALLAVLSPVCPRTIKLFPPFSLSRHHWHEIVYQVLPLFLYCKQWKLGWSLHKPPSVNSNFC